MTITYELDGVQASPQEVGVQTVRGFEGKNGDRGITFIDTDWKQRTVDVEAITSVR